MTWKCLIPSRVKDWLFSIVHTRPIGDKSTVVKAKSSAEALRTVYHLVTWTHEQGGAGVTANFGQWTRIRSSFPPHEAGATRKLLGRLARKMVVDMDDLDRINDLFGEKVIRFELLMARNCLLTMYARSRSITHSFNATRSS